MEIHIYLVGQDAELSQITALYLSHEGYSIGKYQSVEDIWAEPQGTRAHVCIIDFRTPSEGDFKRMQGFCNRNPLVPVTVTATSRSPLDRIICLESGVEDYPEKPYELGELILRVSQLLSPGETLRRKNSKMLMLHGYIIDEERRIIRYKDTVISLTTTEFNLLLMFARHMGYALSRDQILDAVWGRGCCSNYRSVDNMVRQLRKKMTLLQIESIHGYGYRISV